MSAPAPANRRSASGSRRFNPLKVLQPKRRLQQMLSSSPIPVPKPLAATATAGAAAAPVMVPVLAPPAFDYCRFIELDYVPMETGYMVSMRPTKGYATPTKGFDTPTKGYTTPTTGFDTPTKGYATPTRGFDTHPKTLPTRSPERHGRTGHSPSNPRSRRISAPPSGRDPYGNTSLSNSSNSGSCKGSDCSPTKGRHQKYTSCTDNHGIRPPPPEQYLTPLQQKEVCIRHLRARLKETVDRLQDRDSEIGELRGQLCRMQDDWVEEECHRVEAQLALKEARHEIQQLKDAVDTVRTSLGQVTGSSPSDGGGGGSGSSEIQKYFQDINTQNHKLENMLLSMEQAQAAVARDGGEVLGGRRVRAGGSAPASVSGESPGGIPRSLISGIGGGGGGGGGGGRGGAGGSCSCDCSPAHSLTRSSTYTKLSEQALLGDGRAGDFPGLSGGTGPRDSGFVCCGEAGGAVPSRTDLLLEAAFLSEETASLLSSYSTHSLPHTLPRSLPHTQPHLHTSPTHRAMPHSSTCDTLCGGGVGGGGGCGAAPMAVHCCSLGGMGSLSHPCLSHHLYLHHLREQGIQTESCPAAPLTGASSSDLDTIAEQRTFRSQACSPTSTWMSDEGEDAELDDSTASVATATLMSTVTEPLPARSPGLAATSTFPRSATVSCALDGPPCLESDDEEEEEKKDEGMEKEKEDVEEGEGEEQKQQAPVCTAGGQGVETEAAPGRLRDLGQLSAGRQGETMECSAGERLGEEEMDEAGERVSEVEMDGIGERQGETVQCGAGERVKEVGMDEACTAEMKELEPLSSSNHVPSAEPSPTSPVQLMCPDSQPLTSQPKRSLSQDQTPGVTVIQGSHEEDDEQDEVEGAVGGSTTLAGGGGGEGSQSGPVQKSYWSRHFLVDLLAVAVPVVPTVAWLCRGPRHGGQPMYHIGSLLRGCCTVALHSLRRGGGLRHYPAGGGDFGGTQI